MMFQYMTIYILDFSDSRHATSSTLRYVNAPFLFPKPQLLIIIKKKKEAAAQARRKKNLNQEKENAAKYQLKQN